MRRATSQNNDNWENNDTDNNTNLDAGQPKFNLAKKSDSEIVDKNNQSQENRYPNAWVNRVAIHPVSDPSASSDRAMHCSTRAAAVSLSY